VHLVTVDLLGQPLKLEGSTAGWQQLFWGNKLVSQVTKSEGLASNNNVHRFELKQKAGDGSEQSMAVSLEVDLTWQPFVLQYQLCVNDEIITQEELTTKDIEQREVLPVKKQKMNISKVGLLGLGLKLFKSAKVIKVLFATGSLAAYSWLFSLEFALALLLCLVWHEYGHIRAMHYFNMKTKGIYLIPFVGGLAISDDKLHSRWQDVYISIMGPFFGLILSLVFLLGYFITDIEILAGLASFNALLNLFNLLPVLPLDGGHILKSIAFSVNSTLGLIACAVGSGLGIFISYYFGLALLGFLLAIGSVEIVFEYKQRHNSHLIPLERNGQIVSIAWYVFTTGSLAAIIWYLGQGGNSALALPFKILGS
jgi:Zn-dependent protease